MKIYTYEIQNFKSIQEIETWQMDFQFFLGKKGKKTDLESEKECTQMGGLRQT